MPNYSRREFLAATGALLALGSLPSGARAGRKPPSQQAAAPYAVIVPGFLAETVSSTAVDYLNTTIPAVFEEHRHLFPALDAPPPFIVLNTLSDTLVHHGNKAVAPGHLGDETLTLFEVQHLLTTTRFGSVATPHRGASLDMFGRFIYLKQHPRTGYRTPPPLLLEEMLHAQQDATVMQAIIRRDGLDATDCLHAQLKGISELGAHYYTDALAFKSDYVFVLDDGTHCADADEGVARLAARVGATPEELLRALMHDTETLLALDAVALAEQGKPLWAMVTTWRPMRDANGDATGVMPAFMPFAGAQ